MLEEKTDDQEEISAVHVQMLYSFLMDRSRGDFGTISFRPSNNETIRKILVSGIVKRRTKVKDIEQEPTKRTIQC